MQHKFTLAAFVVLVASVWGVGFLWARGDLTGAGQLAAQQTQIRPTVRATAIPKPPPAPAASPSPAPSSTSPSSTDPSPQAGPAPTAAAAGTRARPGGQPGGAATSAALAATVAQERKPVDVNPVRPRPQPQALPPVAEFTVASFNVLGSSHTKKGGHSPGMASGTERMGGALSLLAAKDISVVGIQEFQPDQRNAFRNRAAGWSMYPGLQMGRRAGENSVAWRDDVWTLVQPGLVDIPYFGGRIRPMPYVLLEHKATGVRSYFSTFHNPANIGGNQQRHRNEATRRQINLFNRLEASGIPQFVTGDMNERKEYFCRVTGATPLVAAAGGSNSGVCRPPDRPQIDWIFGSPGAQFTSYEVDRGPLVRRTSDHPLIVAKVTVDGLKYPKAYAAG